jgi:hypothetical protein
MNNCEKCGNPQKMYWCEDCEISGENEDKCDECNNPMELDIHYHDNCNKCTCGMCEDIPL